MDSSSQKVLKIGLALLTSCSFYFDTCQAVDYLKNGLYVADSLYPPFVYGDWIYYVDTVNILKKIPANGSTDQPIVLCNSVNSSPVVLYDTVFFRARNRGLKNTLYKEKVNGTELQPFNDSEMQDRPFVYKDNYVYYLGNDSYYYKVQTDFLKTKLGQEKGLSRPFVYKDYVYFQGLGNALRKVNIDGTDGQSIGGMLTLSSPYVYEDYIYFQGPNNELWKVKTDGTDSGRVKPDCMTLATPFVYLGYIYHRGSDSELWRVSLDGNTLERLTFSGKVHSNPVVYDNWVYYLSNNQIRKVRTGSLMPAFIDVWGEGRIVTDEGIVTGFQEAMNLNMFGHEPVSGPNKDLPIPNLIPIYDCYNPHFNLDDGEISYITVMGSPIFAATAKEMYRVLNKDKGVVILYGYSDNDPSLNTFILNKGKLELKPSDPLNSPFDEPNPQDYEGGPIPGSRRVYGFPGVVDKDEL